MAETILPFLGQYTTAIKQKELNHRWDINSYYTLAFSVDHRNQVVLITENLLTLSHHPSLSSIALGKSSRLDPGSAKSVI